MSAWHAEQAVRRDKGLFVGRCRDLRHAAYVIVQAPVIDKGRLRSLVLDCLRRQVLLFAVVGDTHWGIEHQIDRIIIADGRFAMTSSHASKREALSLIQSMRTSDEDKAGRRLGWAEVRL